MSKTEEALDPRIKKKIEEFVSEWMKEYKIPGFSMSIVEGDRSVYTGGFGSRDLEMNSPATPDTIYGVGSCTKSFTSLGVLILAQEGKIELDDPIAGYLPSHLSGTLKDIDVHHLMTHSSGMPSLGVSEALIARLTDVEEIGVPLGGLDDFYRHIRDAEDEIAAYPGDRFFYFNSGYSLLGKMIEKVSGVDYDRYINEKMLSPLGMERSTFTADIFENDEDVMTPYFLDEDGPRSTAYPLREIGFPAGGLLSSVREMSNYLMMNMNGGTFEGEELVDGDLLKKMFERHKERTKGWYGYGWGIKEFLDEKLVGHSGSIGVSSAYIGFMEEEELGVALASNVSPDYPLEEVGKAILAICLGEDPEGSIPFFTRKSRLEELEGDYRSYKGIKRAAVEKDGSFLRLTFKDKLEGKSIILVPEELGDERCVFYTLSGAGDKVPVEFEISSRSDIDLFIERWRLHKAG